MSTAPVTGRARLADVLAGARRARALAGHDAWAPGRLDAAAAERFDALVAFARARSPFHRARLGGGPPPTMDKALLLEHYDTILTAQPLSRARLADHLASLERDVLLDGRWRVVGTGGSTGRPGAFAFDRDEWRSVMAGFFRWSALQERRPRPGLRIAVVTTTSPRHMSARMAATVGGPPLRALRLDAARPIPELVAALERHRPEELHGYPSILALLADEQLEGRLHIAPRFVGTSSELRTPEMTERITRAWGVAPHDCLALTETGVLAVDCREHAGLHVFEDETLVEVLGDDDRPVGDGELGRLVVTPLGYRTLPLIRYATGDLVRVTREPCACGRPYRRIVAIDGRTDDVLRLPGRAGGTVDVHPIALRSPLAAVAGLGQYQVVHDAGGLHVRVTVRGGADEQSVVAEVRRRVGAALDAAGAEALGLDVRATGAFERSAMGKHRLVVQA